MLSSVLLVFACCLATAAAHGNRVVCHVDGRALVATGPRKIQLSQLEPSLKYCTHLVLGYAVISNDTFSVVAASEEEELLYSRVVALRARYPGLNVLLSVGGGRATEEQRERYFQLLESDEHRMTFINSVKSLVKKYGFDGVDIAWEFPVYKPQKEHSGFGKLWFKIKKVFGYVHNYKDKKADDHRSQFSMLIHDLNSVLRNDYRLLTVTVITNINFKIYYDCNTLLPDINYLQLMAFDYHTPVLYPQEADYPAPLFPAGMRNPNLTVDGNVQWFLDQGFPGNKLVVGIPTFGRSWQLKKDSRMSGVPPIEADGAGEAGNMTDTEGLLAYPEICTNLRMPGSVNKVALRLVNDLSHRLGSYAYRFPSEGISGLWVGFETPDIAAYKADYVKRNNLGGIAFFDLSLDDYSGICTGEKFPIVQAGKRQFQMWVR